MDTYTTIWNRMLQRASSIDPVFAGDIVRDCFNQLMERRRWSWLRKRVNFFPASYVTAGTVTVTSNQTQVDLVGSTFTPDMAGKQIRIGGPPSIFPPFTITQYASPTRIII